MVKKFKVAFIGAGSIVFTRKLVRDLLSVPEFSSIDITFFDIDEKNLDISRKLCQSDIDKNNIPVKIKATTDRREALKGARYIVNSIKVGGMAAWEKDLDIPLSYGVDQAIGDTLCAGGIMYGQRNIPVILDICKDIRELAEPDALLVNLSNPLSMCTWAANKYGKVRTIGLCHGVQLGHLQFAHIFHIPMSKIHISCVGINHCGFYTEVKTDEKDLNPLLLEGFRKHPKYSENEKIRLDVFERMGYYCTESNGHMSEYTPWYRKKLDDIKNWVGYEDVFCGETKGYYFLSQRERAELNATYEALIREETPVFSEENRSEEHFSYIIEGLETNRVYRGHINVVNNGVIKNFIDDAIVEVPCYVDIHGINVPMVGEMDTAMAQMCNNMIAVQKLSVEAAAEGNVQKLKQAMLLDPLVGAVLNPKQIWQMTDELMIAEESWLPQFNKQAFADAKKRIDAAKQNGTYFKPDPTIKGGALREGESPHYKPDWSMRR